MTIFYLTSLIAFSVGSAFAASDLDTNEVTPDTANDFVSASSDVTPDTAGEDANVDSDGTDVDLDSDTNEDNTDTDTTGASYS